MTQSRQMSQAVTLYQSFREKSPKKLIKLPVKIPSVVACMGHVEAIAYRTTHGSKVELYKHDFAKGSRPLLCVSGDGRQLMLLGGRYEWTDRGIQDEDASGKLISDPKHGSVINPRKRKPVRYVQKCEWFYLCENPAVKTRSHPMLGQVPICKRCDDKVTRIGGMTRRNPKATPAHICPICNKAGGSHCPDALHFLRLPGEFAHPRCVQKASAKVTGTAPVRAHAHKKVFYFESHADAKEYAITHGFPIDRIIPYQRGWAIQLRKSGPYVGNPKRRLEILSRSARP